MHFLFSVYEGHGEKHERMVSCVCSLYSSQTRQVTMGSSGRACDCSSFPGIRGIYRSPWSWPIGEDTHICYSYLSVEKEWQKAELGNVSKRHKTHFKYGWNKLWLGVETWLSLVKCIDSNTKACHSVLLSELYPNILILPNAKSVKLNRRNISLLIR